MEEISNGLCNSSEDVNSSLGSFTLKRMTVSKIQLLAIIHQLVKERNQQPNLDFLHAIPFKMLINWLFEYRYAFYCLIIHLLSTLIRLLLITAQAE